MFSKIKNYIEMLLGLCFLIYLLICFIKFILSPLDQPQYTHMRNPYGDGFVETPMYKKRKADKGITTIEAEPKQKQNILPYKLEKDVIEKYGL